jgi:excisionase family DNA binding protein
MEELLLTPEAAAEVLSVGRTTVYWLMREGRLPSVRIGRSRRIPAAALAQFVDELTREAS